MEGDVLREIDDRLRERAPALVDQLLEAVESGEAAPSAVLSSIKELKLLIAQLVGQEAESPVEIVVRLEEGPHSSCSG